MCLIFIGLFSACSFKLSGGSSTTIPSPSDESEDKDNGIEPQAMFDSIVKPAFQAKCTTCHNEPRFGGNGPLSIFSYNAMVMKLMNGSADDSNELMNKMRNKIFHDGGDVCGGDDNKSPCFEVKIWWARETASSGGVGNAAPLGQIGDVSVRGIVSGWAVDIDDERSAVEIEAYLDGPKGTGTLIGKFTASNANPVTGFAGSHGFQYEIPAQYRNGTSHTLSLVALGTDGKHSKELSKSPHTYQLYSPKPAGQNYFDSTVLPALQAKCVRCHLAFTNYEQVYYDRLSSPKPAVGGSATTNFLYAKGSNAIAHSEGNVCGGSSPCTEIANWWRLEFE